MCEPNHSIVQYPVEDDKGPTESRIDAIPETENFWEGKINMIDSWYHLSRMGKGHSEAIGAMSPLARQHYLPQDTKYEAAWWCRQVRLDGSFNGLHSFEKEDALKAATAYAHKVSIGNLSLLRQFLETSIKKSDRKDAYVMHFLDDMLLDKGREAFMAKFKLITGMKSKPSRFTLMRYFNDPTAKTDNVLSAMLGLTRVRSLLVPEWADDNKLWLPKQPKLILA